ncbi:MAG: T9SS type A sorting domain-containing protein [Bacteroidota bacterium]
MRLVYMFFLIAGFTTLDLHAQSPGFIYRTGNPASESLVKLAADGSGGVYVAAAGTGQGATYTDASGGFQLPGFSDPATLTLIHYASTGTALFVFRLSSTDKIDSRGLAPAPNGGVYVLGRYRGTVDFDPGAGTETRTSSTNQTFVAEYSPSGGFLGVMTLDIDGFPGAIARDPFTGGYVIAGDFRGSADFDPGPGVANITANTTPASMYIARYTTANTYIEASAILAQGTGATDGIRPFALTADASGTVYIGGAVLGTVDFDPGPGTILGGPSGSSRAFVLALGSSAPPKQQVSTYKWRLVNAQVGAASPAGRTFDLVFGASGKLYAGGWFNYSTSFDGQVLDTGNPTGNELDGFVVEINTSDGSVSDAFSIGSPSLDDYVEALAYDQSTGDLFVGGQFKGTVDFDPSPTTMLTRTTGTSSSTGDLSHFVARYSGQTPIYVSTKDGAPGRSLVNEMVLGANGGAYAAGLYFAGGGQQSPDFNPGSGAANINNAGDADVFILGLQPNGALPVELTHFEAVSDGSDVMLSWATATETNNAGFAVEHVALDVAGEPVADSEWREVGFVEGAGTVESPRAYGFRVSDLPAGTHWFRLKQVDFDGAFEYSPIVEATVVPAGASLAVYPQPAVGSATVVVELPRRQRVKVQVYDLLGQVVETLHAGEAEGALQLEAGAGLPAGVYVVRAEGESLSVSRRIVLAR